MPRTQLSIEDKFSVITRFEAGVSVKTLMTDHNTSRSAIYAILKSKEKVIEQYEKCDKVKRIRASQHSDLDNDLYNWYKEQKLNNVQVNGPMLQVKANEIAVALKKENFVCGPSWIQRFRARHNIVFGDPAGKKKNKVSGTEKFVHGTMPPLSTENDDNNEQEDPSYVNMIPEVQIKSEPSDGDDSNPHYPPDLLCCGSNLEQNPYSQNSMKRHRDEFDILGEEIAIRVRKLETNYARCTVIHKIQTVLYEAGIGAYDESKPFQTVTDENTISVNKFN